MRELAACWRHTRMIVLTAFCAALYVAVLLPFKIATIIPGITEIRPGAALPVLFSVFFGPAAAWGAAFGNVIGDVLGGTIGPGSIPGLFGNLIYGFVPYRVLRNYLGNTDRLWSTTGWLTFIFAIILASGLCATIISLGVAVIGIPFGFLVHTIFLNNLLVSLLLTPLLIRALGKRIRGMKLDYEQIMEKGEIAAPLMGRAGPPILFLIMLAFYALMMIPSFRSFFPFPLNLIEIVSSILLFIAALLLL